MKRTYCRTETNEIADLERDGQIDSFEFGL